MAWAPWLLLLLGSASVLSAAPSDVMEGECGVPTLVENAQIAEGSNSEKLRYSCMKNYKRKAGTSNLILCKQDKHTKEYQWTNSNLICIRDPLLPPSTTPEKTSRGGKLVWAFVGEMGNGTKLRYYKFKNSSIHLSDPRHSQLVSKKSILLGTFSQQVLGLHFPAPEIY
ncbi:interleukin-15 receptor subunit alpha [Anolis carolinensis]|uniref:interleukin-15 receptor subunit alpha n=1 Tax=Anolis carolinensis TaxID=28377 RepID=UPI002F2B81FF